MREVLIDILLEGYENSPEKRVFPLFPLFWRVPLMPELVVHGVGGAQFTKFT